MRKILSALSLIAASIFLLSSFALFPAISAYGSNDNWQIGAAGTGTMFGNGFGFWGWCALAGHTSGTHGDCQFSQYLHMSGNTGSVQCETSFDITGWHSAASLTNPKINDFFIDSGTVTFNPASSTQACIYFMGLAGFNMEQTGQATAKFVTPSSDTGIPAAPAHYNLNGLVEGPITFTELQYQVALNPH